MATGIKQPKASQAKHKLTATIMFEQTFMKLDNILCYKLACNPQVIYAGQL